MENVKVAMFAYDTAILATGNNVEEAAEKLYQATNQITDLIKD